MSVPNEHLLTLAALLFGLGVLGFLVRRNVIIVLASVELMLNAANLSLVAGSRRWSATVIEAGGTEHLHGPILALFVILVAAAEAAVGLALVIALYRLKKTASLEAVGELKG